MPPARARIWIGLGLSVLATDAALPFRAAQATCLPSDQAPQGEAGEGGGESGLDPMLLRIPVLDRMAAQIAAAQELQGLGDAEDADILAAAAADEGFARLDRLAEGKNRALHQQLDPLAQTPGDAGLRVAALRAIETELAAAPDIQSAKGRIHRSASLTAQALEAYGAALNCGGPLDRAAYAEARALVLRARTLLDGTTDQAAARDMMDPLADLTARLPAAAPASLPPLGEISALVSRVLLAATEGSN